MLFPDFSTDEPKSYTGTHPEYLAQLQAIEDKKEMRLKRAAHLKRLAEENLEMGLEVMRRVAGDSFIVSFFLFVNLKIGGKGKTDG